jgi:nicotinate phosphoribosyltransferase
MSPLPSQMPSTALFTDHYELTMLRAALASGLADRPVVFEVFARRLPFGRRYGVLAGIQRLLEAVERFTFDPDDLADLRAEGIIDEAACGYLADYRFSGDLDGYAEGEAYFEYSPVLTVSGTFGECVLLETVALSILNHDSAVAAAAARMVCAAGDRPCIEMGSRRTHELSAVAAARAAYLVGFAATSNLAAGRWYGIPTTGTAAHAFTLVHGDERAAFQAQVDTLGVDTTLLVDTYDVGQGIRTAVEVAGPELGAIRLDSGDLREQVRFARALLNDLGAHKTRIVVTSDLDERMIATLAAEAVAGYGVGTSVVTGSGAPTAGFVYKLVAREVEGVLQPVAKKSIGKISIGGRKYATRRLDSHGTATAEVIYADPTGELRNSPPVPTGTSPSERPLIAPLIRAGDVVCRCDVAEARIRWRESRAELPATAMQLSAGEAALPTLTIGADGLGTERSGVRS